MNTNAAPSFRKISAALRVTTERLALELSNPQPDAPDWNAFEWDVARAAAAMQGISAMLAHSLRWNGPQCWQDFLLRQSEESRLRHDKIGKVLAAIDAASRRHSIALIALKGSALREFGLWRMPFERPMGDVDLLVRPHELDALSQALNSIGYEHSYVSRRHVVFRPCGAPPASGFAECALNPVPIEVHTRISEMLPTSVVDITARLWPAQPGFGINRYASNAALLRHLLLHCAGNMRAHALRLSQLRDVGHFSTRMTGGDWDELLDGAESWWMYPPLQMSARYFPGFIPSVVLDSARRYCPTLLRRAAERSLLTTMSWSNLHIDALPGIEWSRSPLEALRYASSRILPSKVALGELELAMNVLPGLRTIPWYGQRHATRILRWLFTRPPRVQTMRSVLDALAAHSREGFHADQSVSPIE